MTPESLLETQTTAAPAAAANQTDAQAHTAELLAAARRQGAAHSDERPNENTSPSAKLYRLFWRWHFYAGMIVAPIILIASITGGLYVFIDELKPIMYPALFRAESAVGSGPMLSHAELASAVAKQLPKTAKINAVTPTADDALNAQVEVDGKPPALVDPRTGKIAGHYDQKNSFFGIVLRLHRQLLLDLPGRITVELAASWGVILLITGVYLWWPRKSGRAQSPGAGVWYPRFKAPLTVVLRDLHTVVGFYGVATAAIILVTGLFFTQFFGNAYKSIQNGLGGMPANFAKRPDSKITAAELQKKPQPISYDQALAVAEPLLPGVGPVRVEAPKDPKGSYRVARAGNSSPTLHKKIDVDQYSGAVLGTVGWNDLPAHQKVRISIYPIHVGSIYGTTTKVLALLTCLALALLAITGVWMWWRRRPRGTWGLPPSNAGIGVPVWLLGVIVVLGLVMPAVGMSLILILIGDFLVVRFLARRRATPVG